MILLRPDSTLISASVARLTDYRHTGLWGDNFDDQLAQLAFPVLVIYGKADDSPFTGEAVAQKLARALPNATLTAMEHSGHWPYLEEPEQFQTVISGFLAK